MSEKRRITFTERCTMLADEMEDLGAVDITPELVADALASTGLALAVVPGASTANYYREMLGGGG